MATITFSVTNGNNSNAPYTYFYNVNGGTSQSVQSPANNDVVTLTIPSGTAGTFIYQLTAATDSPPSNNNVDIDNTSNIVTITVNPLPVVDFTFANNQCSGSAIQFNSLCFWGWWIYLFMEFWRRRYFLSTESNTPHITLLDVVL